MKKKESHTGLALIQPVISQPLFESDFYQLKNWGFNIEDRSSSRGYNDCLCILYVKRGQLKFDLSKESYPMHSGHIMIDKPDYDYRLRGSIGECCIFNFTDSFYRRFLEDLNMKQSFFFSNENILSLMMLSTPETDYLHHQIQNAASRAGKLEMDNLVLDFFNQVIAILTNTSLGDDMSVFFSKNRIATIESAKEYLYEHFASDISLQDLSAHCFISPFHFSRLFKKFTSFSPHQYLQNIRLKHGEMLLKSGVMPITEISFASGFSSVEYFATAFRQKYGVSPSGYRG